MKKLLFIFMLCSPLISSAQNWKSVRMNDTTYYTIPAADDYLRVIWIDSAKSIGADSIYYFYPSIRLGNTTTNCLDTLGPTWLGKNFIKKSNGDELFFNRWLDTIVMKPNTLLNNSWLLHTDTANNTYWATVSALDTMTIDNQLDSIKEVTIEVYNGSTPLTSHIHNNRKMILSKNHGMIECLEWYGFPFINSTIPSSVNDNPFLMTAEVHERFPQHLVPLTLQPDYNLIYQVGNEWQFKTTGSVTLISTTSYIGTYRIDATESFEIVSTSSLANGNIAVTYNYCNYRNIKGEKANGSGNPPTYYDTTTKSVFLLSDTVTTLSNFPQFKKEYQPERKNVPFNIPFIGTQLNEYSLSIDSVTPSGIRFSKNKSALCYNSVNSCYNLNNGQCYFGSETNKYFHPFGQSSYYLSRYNGNVGITDIDTTRKLTYYKFGNFTDGKKVNCLALYTQDFEKEKFKVYPNPASSTIHMKDLFDTKIQSLTLFSLDGKQVSKAKNKNELAIQEISNGLYILIAETNKGTIRKKIVIQH